MTSLRILMVAHVPLVRELGAGRIQLELGEELRRLGHDVEFFDLRDALLKGRHWDRFRPGRFAERAASYVQAKGRQFDVVDAHHGCLPFTKRELAFGGLLVARSAGLYAFYSDFERYARSTWPRLIPGSAPAKAMHRWWSAGFARQCWRSLETCDLALLLNDDEVKRVQQELGTSAHCAVVPFGLADEQAEALAAARSPVAKRLRRREVAFVGAWGLRKGSADWPEIVRQVRERAPDARFAFLGTGTEPEELRAQAVTVVPAFRPEELPALLADATIGALPSYAEGQPFGLLEELAAGLPCVAYDVSGPRSMLGKLNPSLLVPLGSVERFADRLADLLLLGEPEYRTLSLRAVEVADRYRWRDIARKTARLYAAGLARVQRGERVST